MSHFFLEISWYEFRSRLDSNSAKAWIRIQWIGVLNTGLYDIGKHGGQKGKLTSQEIGAMLCVGIVLMPVRIRLSIWCRSGSNVPYCVDPDPTFHTVSIRIRLSFHMVSIRIRLSIWCRSGSDFPYGVKPDPTLNLVLFHARSGFTLDSVNPDP